MTVAASGADWGLITVELSGLAALLLLFIVFFVVVVSAVERKNLMVR